MAKFSRAQKIMLHDQLMELKSSSCGKMIRRTIYGNEVCVEVEVFSTKGKKHVLRVYIPPDFPNSCPPMVAISPDGLLRRKDRSLLGIASRQDHVLSSKDGYTRIYHFPANKWVGNRTLFQVIKKGLVWLEAYELHLQTGDAIDLFLKAEDIVLHDGVPLQLDSEINVEAKELLATFDGCIIGLFPDITNINI